MKKEKLIRLGTRWEIAHIVTNTVTGKEQWERRDGSYICDVDSTERDVQPLPKAKIWPKASTLGGMHLSNPNTLKGAKGPHDT